MILTSQLQGSILSTSGIRSLWVYMLSGAGNLVGEVLLEVGVLPGAVVSLPVPARAKRLGLGSLDQLLLDFVGRQGRLQVGLGEPRLVGPVGRELDLVRGEWVLVDAEEQVNCLLLARICTATETVIRPRL